MEQATRKRLKAKAQRTKRARMTRRSKLAAERMQVRLEAAALGAAWAKLDSAIKLIAEVAQLLADRQSLEVGKTLGD